MRAIIEFHYINDPEGHTFHSRILDWNLPMPEKGEPLIIHDEEDFEFYQARREWWWEHLGDDEYTTIYKLGCEYVYYEKWFKQIAGELVVVLVFINEGEFDLTPATTDSMQVPKNPNDYLIRNVLRDMGASGRICTSLISNLEMLGYDNLLEVVADLRRVDFTRVRGVGEKQADMLEKAIEFAGLKLKLRLK